MIIQSALTPKAYRSALKERMGSRFAFFTERFTGRFLGRLFYVTHHAGYEYDRRYTSPKNSALGYIKETKNGSEIHFLHFQGMLCPHFLLPYLLILSAYVALIFPALKERILILIFLVLFFVGYPLVATVLQSATDRSIEGEKSLFGLLHDPTDFFGYLNSIQKH